LRILWWIDHLGHGGTQIALYQLVSHFHERGFRQSVVCLNTLDDRKAYEQLEQVGVEVLVIGRLKLITGIGLISTVFWIKRQKFDVTITMLFFSDVLGQILSKACNIPFRISAQQSENTNYSALRCSILGLILRWTSKVVVLSKHLAESLSESYLPDNTDIQVIPNGVDVQEHAPSRDSNYLRAKLGIDSSSYLVGYFGRLSIEKGVDILIKALSTTAVGKFHLIIAGDGQEERNLKEQINNLGLIEQVHFMGYLHDVSKLYHCLDVYVQPSRFEGIPFSVLEAMANGCPVVASSLVGLRELIVDGEHGLLVEPENYKLLAKAIDNTVSQKGPTLGRVQKAKSRVKKHFSYSSVCNAWECLVLEKHTKY